MLTSAFVSGQLGDADKIQWRATREVAGELGATLYRFSQQGIPDIIVAFDNSLFVDGRIWNKEGSKAGPEML